jgi:hypothetical protein
MMGCRSAADMDSLGFERSCSMSLQQALKGHGLFVLFGQQEPSITGDGPLWLVFSACTGGD